MRSILSNVYSDHGIRLEYPAEWQVEVSDEGSGTSVSIQESDGTAFALVTLDDGRPDPAEVAAEALAAMRDEYPGLDAYPAVETLDGHEAVGFDVDFISLDLISTCVIRCFRTPQRTVLILQQWCESAGGDSLQGIFKAIRKSIHETDAET